MKREARPLTSRELDEARVHAALAGDVRFLKRGTGLIATLVFTAPGYPYEAPAAMRERVTRTEESVSRVAGHAIRVEDRRFGIENGAIFIEDRLGGIETLIRTLTTYRSEGS